MPPGDSSLCCGIPEIFAISGGSNPTGNEVVTITGENFESCSSVGSSLLSLTIGGLSATDVNRVSSTEITAKVPPMSGDGSSANREVVLTVQTQANVVAFNEFSYSRPIITKVSKLALSVVPGQSGIPVIVEGLNFADVPIRSFRISANKEGTDCNANIECLDITRISDTKLTCMYPEGGTPGCTTRKFFVTVAEQTSEETDAAQLCYDQEGGLKGVPFGVYIAEGNEYQYNVYLELAPSEGVKVLLQVKTNEPGE